MIPLAKRRLDIEAQVRGEGGRAGSPVEVSKYFTNFILFEYYKNHKRNWTSRIIDLIGKRIQAIVDLLS